MKTNPDSEVNYVRTSNHRTTVKQQFFNQMRKPCARDVNKKHMRSIHANSRKLPVIHVQRKDIYAVFVVSNKKMARSTLILWSKIILIICLMKFSFERQLL